MRFLAEWERTSEMLTMESGMTMFIDELSKMEIDDFSERAKNLSQRSENEQQLTSYEDMLKFAQRNFVDNFDKTAVVGLAHMAYGWMPTMIRRTKLSENFKEWKKNIENGCLGKGFLEKVMELTNDSIVGASKLLHFLNPHDYPIYDSKVYGAVIKNGKHNLSKDVDNYISYVKILQALAKNPKNQSVILNIQNILINKGYLLKECSAIRVLEVCLYASASTKNGGKKTRSK